ncbi:hypothetical protein MC378_02515 [Polaribacter sp. MSW13]|uniref:Peptidase E n=1 Tax=Polaribacter marinus TaxID=2916838 RepID=A0A9X1VP40_9FLAO|nr:DUF6702 family protein [Polaribacter marinus]MCI2228025.1 hypothetical protein [Polaribacter marinus]
MKNKKIFLLLFIIPILSFTTHKYYLSLTQINYKSETKSIQIIINVFMDDIETALNKKYNIDLQLTSDNELKNNDVYFEKYLNSKLHFKVNNISKKYTYIGKEYDGDLVFFYLEIEDIKEVKNIEISNQILMDQFPQQENLVKSKVGKKHKSVLLTKKEFSSTLTY